MDKRTVSLVMVIFALLIIGMFIFAHLKHTELTVAPSPTITATEKTEIPYPDILRIDAKHFFVNGKHTYVGEILMPTPCDLLTTEAVIAESMPEQVTLDFNVINNSDTCAAIVTPQRFSITVVASAEAVTKARFVGRDVVLNIIPAAPGESPEEFELFIKG